VNTPRGALEARHVICAVPLARVAQFLGIDAGGLVWRGLRLVNLMLDAPAGLGSTWAYLAGSSGIVSRVQEPARRSPFMVPPGCGSLQLEIPASPGDGLWELDEHELARRAQTEIETRGIALSGRPLGAFATRLEHAYPVYGRQTRARVAALLARIAAVPNLDVCGRQGRFSYIFADRAMEDGIAAARRWLGVPSGVPQDGGGVPCPTEAASLAG
jgi:protoporphyrinogen oxidase